MTQREDVTYRYPGSPPFGDTDVDRLVFYGRDVEADTVLYSVLSSPLLVLYAISGTGKTSLMNAGVMKPLRDRGLWPVSLRLNDPSRRPLDLIDEQIREAADRSATVTVMRHPDEEHPTCLWDYLAGMEVWKGNDLLQPVLVFDQVEELFTLDWSEDVRQRFISEFGEVVRRHRNPDNRGNTPSISDLPPPDVRIVLMIREDSLGELDAFAVDVPQIMRTRFRLIGLDPEQAAAAIEEPAQVDDPRLGSARFRYTDEASQMLIDFLRTRIVRGEPTKTATVEPSQLQIICEYVEKSLVPESGGNSQETIHVTAEDLGGPEGLNEILRDFYRREIEDFNGEERRRIRDLCETGLISHNSRRLSLEQEEITESFKVSKDCLGELVERRLLRADPRVGSVYYELAHDTLVAPILAYRQQNPSAGLFTRVVAGWLKFVIEPFLWLMVILSVLATLYQITIEVGLFSATDSYEIMGIGSAVGALVIFLVFALVPMTIRWARLKWLTY